MHTHPEHGKAPKCNTYGNVVHDGHVQIPTASAKVAFVVCTGNFHDQTRERKEWLDLDVFCRYLQVSTKGTRIRANAIRRMPRLRERNVYGSLGSISLRHRLTGNTAEMGGRPCKRIRRERSPPR